MTELRTDSCRIRFGEDGFFLHRFDPGAPAFTDTGAAPRTVRLEGWIVPPAGAALAPRVGLLQRLAADRGGFVLSREGKETRALCAAAPSFSCDPPFARGEAASFTLTAVTVPDGFFRLPARTLTVSSRTPAAAFPLAVGDGFAFGFLTREGSLEVENPGDAPAGFTLTARPLGGTLASLTLSLGGDSLTVARPVAGGEELTICTEPGAKSVTAAGANALAGVTPDSVFFPLPPGVSVLRWQASGTACPSLTLSFRPLTL